MAISEIICGETELEEFLPSKELEANIEVQLDKRRCHQLLDRIEH